jgi:hypothetical protein
VEGAGVALGVAAVVGVIQKPDTARSGLDHAVTWVGSLDHTYATLSWGASIGFAVLAAVIAALRSRHTSYDGTSFWEFELRMPSWSTTLFGCAAVLGLAAAAIQLCEQGNRWGLVALLLALWMVMKFLGFVSRGWQLFFGTPSHF